MGCLEHWHSIAARVRSLTTAAQLHASFTQFNSSDPYSRSRYLSAQCWEVFLELQAFLNLFKPSLSPLAAKAIESFLVERLALFKSASTQSDIDGEQSRTVIVLLATLETQITFLLSDDQPTIKARSELAFSHLQRSIAADDEIRNKWQSAFEDGETSCEALGAVHLLSHGLYAFKVSAVGGITDLVFQEPADTGQAQIFSGLVLTEWKKCDKKEQIASAFNAARLQAELYAPGALSGNELRGYRYAVVVSPHTEKVPADLISKGVIYRHILICVNPLVPSKHARVISS